MRLCAILFGFFILFLEKYSFIFNLECLLMVCRWRKNFCLNSKIDDFWVIEVWKFLSDRIIVRSVSGMRRLSFGVEGLLGSKNNSKIIDRSKTGTIWNSLFFGKKLSIFSYFPMLLFHRKIFSWKVFWGPKNFDTLNFRYFFMFCDTQIHSSMFLQLIIEFWKKIAVIPTIAELPTLTLLIAIF